MMNVATDNSDFADIDGQNGNTLYNLLTSRVRTIPGTADNMPGGYDTELFFHDGTAIIINSGSKNCTENAKCSAIVDVNGHKKPNAITPDATHLKDRYYVNLYNQVVEPQDQIGQDLLYKTYQTQASN
jgi:hypothetical protein